LRKVYKLQFQKLVRLHRENWLDEKSYPEEDKNIKNGVSKRQNNQNDSLGLLKTHLKNCSQTYQIAQATIATSRDLEKLVDGHRNVKCLFEWRNEIFGKDALKLLECFPNQG
jgi:ribonuclease D